MACVSRRLTEDDPWISKYFNMSSLFDGLNDGGLIRITLVDWDMLTPFCRCCDCGRVLDVIDEACICVDEVRDLESILRGWTRRGI